MKKIPKDNINEVSRRKTLLKVIFPTAKERMEAIFSDKTTGVLSANPDEIKQSLIKKLGNNRTTKRGNNR